MQQPDSAIAAYERYLAAPSIDRIFVDAYDRGFVLERLGALYEQRNERTPRVVTRSSSISGRMPIQCSIRA